MYYQMSSQLRKIEKDIKATSKECIIQVFTYENWISSQLSKKFDANLFKGYDSIRFCKVESYQDYLITTFNMPLKHMAKEKRKFICYIQANRIIFVDDSGTINKILEKLMTSKSWKEPSMASFFGSFLESLIEDDLIYLEELENKITRIEDSILDGEINHFNHKSINFRKELLGLHYYYAQLIEMGEDLQENEDDIFEAEHLRLFELFTRKVMRLQNNVQMLREYLAQIREEYQAQIDIRQNNVMKILTVVTTIFLPLTLIVGWYGMNFEYMPELSWKYGYPLIIAVSILIVIITIWLCRKKKFL